MPGRCGGWRPWSCPFERLRSGHRPTPAWRVGHLRRSRSGEFHTIADILATGVVEESEGFDDGAVGIGGEPSEGESVGANAEPVRGAVDAVGVELIPGKDVAGDGDRIECHGCVDGLTARSTCSVLNCQSLPPSRADSVQLRIGAHLGRRLIRNRATSRTARSE